MSQECIQCPNPGCENGIVDTGGMTPWGAGISIKCTCCDGSGTITRKHYEEMLAEEDRLKGLVGDATKPVL